MGKIYNTLLLKYFSLISGLALFSCTGMGQTWSVPSTSAKMQMGAIIYIENVYARPGSIKPINDTITGTAFLIADGKKVYMVTAKHLVTAKLTGADQQLATNELFISASFHNDDKGFKISGLSNWIPAKMPFIFSSDQEDIAIISLQQKAYKQVLTYLQKKDIKPIPVDSIDSSNNQSAGQSFFHPFFLSYLNKGGIRERQLGLSPGIIQSFDSKSPSYLIEHFGNPTFSGSPIFFNGKIIGIYSLEGGVLTNADIVSDPFHKAKTALVTKSLYVIPLLKELQIREATPGFN